MPEFELYVYYTNESGKIYCPECVEQNSMSGLVKLRNNTGSEKYCSLCKEAVHFVGQTYRVRYDWSKLQSELGE